MPLRASEEEVVERRVSVGEAFFDRSPTADPSPCALLCAAELLSAMACGFRSEERIRIETLANEIRVAVPERLLPPGSAFWSLTETRALLEKRSGTVGVRMNSKRLNT